MIASTELIQRLNTLNHNELAWLSGYCWAQSQQKEHPLLANLEQTIVPPVMARKLLILSASQTGNAKRVADQLHQHLQDLSVEVRLENVGDYKSKSLSQEDIVILLSSTQGEGEFPEEAISFSKFLFGKKAPDLSALSFAVLGLGDSSYPLFCEAGKKLDARFAELGATRLYERLDCDVDYDTQVQSWQQELSKVLTELVQTSASVSTSTATAQQPPSLATQRYSKSEPYTARLLTRQKITSRHANKETLHLEIDLADSGITYSAGDSLGVYVKNSPYLVTAFIQALNLDPTSSVLRNGTTYSLQDVLTEQLELTQNTAALVKKWATLSHDKELLALSQDNEAIQQYAAETPLLALIQQYPAAIDAQIWVDFLRPLSPRLYSIASAQDEVGEEVHVTLGVVSYEHQGVHYSGVASDYLGTHLEEDAELQVFVEANPRFRLPENKDAPIIMIGAGTGIAPFRAFMQQREQDETNSQAWLIFGNQKFTDDFLYQSEWQRWHKLGLLHKTSLAWSRQKPNQKVYVQDKLREDGAALWEWLQKGAHIYVCGDANQMAKSVEQALLQCIRDFGQLDADSADEYLDQLRDTQRYQRDVY